MFDTALTLNDLLFLAKGAQMTLIVTAVSVAAGTVLGVLFGVIRTQFGPYWSMPLTFALDIFRSVPLLIQLVLANAFQSIAAGEESKSAVASAITSLDKAARKGAIHPRNAARRKSRLVKRLAGITPRAASPAGAVPAEMPAAAAGARKKPAVKKAPAKKTAKK